jgi:hypothetical protein
MTLLNHYRQVWLRICIAYYRLALQHIDPCHPDVPEIVRTLVKLSDELDELKGVV